MTDHCSRRAPFRRLRTWAAALAAAATLPACAHHGAHVQIGVRRMALDLAFKDPSKARPATVEQVLVPAPEAPVSNFLANQSPRSLIAAGPALRPEALGPPPHPACPTAPAGAVPRAPAPLFIKTAPAAGVYRQHNSGAFEITGGPAAKGPYPAASQEEVRNVKTESTPGPLPGQGPTTVVTYEVVQPGVQGGSTVASYQITATELDLVKVESATAAGTTTFQPSPPVTLMQFGREGTSWSAGGVDPSTGTAMVVQGSIVRRENVDVCGTVYEAYRVTSTEQVSNVADGYNSQTDANDPNVYDVATGLGGLFLSQHVHTTTTFDVNGSPVTVALNYTSVFDSAQPQPAP
jgi:hypothetical protein